MWTLDQVLYADPPRSLQKSAPARMRAYLPWVHQQAEPGDLPSVPDLVQTCPAHHGLNPL
jgi:hypothetical protein